MEPNQELAIIDDIKSGNSESYRFIVDRYHTGLIQHLYNLTRDPQASEDIAQEAFIRAYEKLSQYNSTYSFSTWLYKIADSIAFRQFEKTKFNQDIDEIEDLIPDDKPAVPELIDREFDAAAVKLAVENLPFSYKRVITLYYWEGFSYEDIANIIDRPVGTVRTWLFRAKEQLRKELQWTN